MLSFKEYSESRKINTHYEILRNKKPNPDLKEIDAAHRLGLITPEQREELLKDLKK